MNRKPLIPGMTFESDTEYYADKKEYHIYPSGDFREIHVWWTFMNTAGTPLRAAFVLDHVKNVTVDLCGAKLIFHGRIMPFAVFDCENVRFRNFSIDYDRPFYTQGTVLSSEPGKIVLDIPKEFGFRVEGHDLIAVSDTWEHRLTDGDMLLRCFDPVTKKPSSHSDTILALVGDEIHPRPNPPLPIHHLYAEQGEGRTLTLTGLPDHFRPLPGEILAMTHEDRRKEGFLLERDTDTAFENIRLLHIGAMGIVANLCHNITADGFAMYLDGETGSRIITVNADSFHCFHCSGLIRLENCRFENMLDDAVNIHGNYLVLAETADGGKTFVFENRAASLLDMEYLRPGDRVTVYRQNTQEIRAELTVSEAVYEPGQTKRMRVTFTETPACALEAGDILESCRMPEIEIRNCVSKCMGGFRISSGRRVLIEQCRFETAGFSVAFTGDMNYWYENGPVRDVTVRNCEFIDCGAPVATYCGFRKTEAAPYYHKNLVFENNTIRSSRSCVLNLSDMDGIVYRNNTFIPLEDRPSPAGEHVVLHSCDHVTIE